MATGKTHSKYARFYADSFDLSGDTLGVGPLAWEFDAEAQAALTDGVKNVSHGVGHPMFSVGTLNAFFNNDTDRAHDALEQYSGQSVIVSVPVGIRAAPAAGDPVFTNIFSQGAYQVVANGHMALTIPYENVYDAGESVGMAYGIPWGHVLHAKAAETGVNAGNYDVDGGASSALGGYGVVHLFSTDGTVTFSIEHSATGVGGWSTLLSFDQLAAAGAAIKQTAAVTTTVNQYLRWQLALGTATSVTFFMAFVRGTGV